MGCGASSDAAPKNADAAPGSDETRTAPLSNMDIWGGMVAAWGEGEFADLKNPAWNKFYAKDFVCDASAASGIHKVFKTYKGHKGFKEWLDMLADFEMPDLDMKAVDGPKSAPGTVVHKYTVTSKSKTTGKSCPGPVTDLCYWTIDEKSGKMKHLKIYFGSPESYAYILDKDYPKPAPQPKMPDTAGVTPE